MIYCKHYLCVAKHIQDEIKKAVKAYRRNEDSITLLNITPHVFTTTVKRLISHNPNEALINCVGMHNVRLQLFE